MKQELEKHFEIQILDIPNKKHEITAGRGQCLVQGCPCAAFHGTGTFICDCGHYDSDHQDIGSKASQHLFNASLNN